MSERSNIVIVFVCRVLALSCHNPLFVQFPACCLYAVEFEREASSAQTAAFFLVVSFIENCDRQKY